VLYKNEEMYSLMQALNIEDSIADLRFDKVILATDADVDGLHIRNLLLTFFLHYFEPLVNRNASTYPGNPDLPGAQQGETFYCYSDQDMDEAILALKAKGKGDRAIEMTRFKGLGEILAARIQAVHRPGHAHQTGAHRFPERSEPGTANSIWGKTPRPERKQYIMDHLIVRPV
jgi:topoisomerase IV subunit B